MGDIPFGAGDRLGSLGEQVFDDPFPIGADHHIVVVEGAVLEGDWFHVSCKIALMATRFMWNPWSGVHRYPQGIYQVLVATATKRSPRFCGAQLNPSHGTGAWALQEL